jgi:hypothetical protein
VSSLLLHLLLKIRILVYKIKSDPDRFRLSAPDLHSFSVSTFTVVVFSALVVVIAKVNSLSLPEINLYPNYLFVYVHQVRAL